MQFQVKVIDSKGVTVASTYVDADDRSSLASEIEQVATDVFSGLNDWLDGVFDDDAADD